MGNKWNNRLDAVEQRARAADDLDYDISDDDLARAIMILETMYRNQPNTRELIAHFGEDVWAELVESAQAHCAERQLKL